MPTIQPTKKQHMAWEALKEPISKYVVFGGGAGGGKSWLGAEWLLTNSYFYPGSKWFIGRNELKRLMSTSYLTFKKVCDHHGIPENDWKLNSQYNYIEFRNGSRIDLLDLSYKPSDPEYERLGSTEFTGGWIEEAGEVEFLAFDVLKSRIGRQSVYSAEKNKIVEPPIDFHDNPEKYPNHQEIPPKMLLTCNPNKGWLYREVYKPHKQGVLPKEFVFIKSLYGDNPFTAGLYKEQLGSISNPSTKQRLMYGNWEYDNDPNALMKYDHILDLFSNILPDTEKERRQYITADIARFGQDKTVIYLWQGHTLKQVVIKDQSSIQWVAEQIDALANKHDIPRSHIVIDEDGVGGGVVDYLPGCKGFVANSRPKSSKKAKENYRNLKTQCSYMLAEAVGEHTIAVDPDYKLTGTITREKFKQSLIEELEQIKGKDLDKNQALQIVPKDEVKNVIGRSPDFSDAFMMRMYLDLQGTGGGGNTQPFIPTWQGYGRTRS